MKKKFRLTLLALLTAFSSIAFAAQSDGANNHNSIDSQNSTPFLTDSEMKDVAAGWFSRTEGKYTRYFSGTKKNPGADHGRCLTNSTATCWAKIIAIQTDMLNVVASR